MRFHDTWVIPCPNRSLDKVTISSTLRICMWGQLRMYLTAVLSRFCFVHETETANIVRSQLFIQYVPLIDRSFVFGCYGKSNTTCISSKNIDTRSIKSVSKLLKFRLLAYFTSVFVTILRNSWLVQLPCKMPFSTLIELVTMKSVANLLLHTCLKIMIQCGPVRLNRGTYLLKG